MLFWSLALNKEGFFVNILLRFLKIILNIKNYVRKKYIKFNLNISLVLEFAAPRGGLESEGDRNHH